MRKRKSYKVIVEAERAETEPKVFTKFMFIIFYQV